MESVNPQFLYSKSANLEEKSPSAGKELSFIVTTFLGEFTSARYATLEFLSSGLRLYETQDAKRMISYLDIEHGILLINHQPATQEKLERFKEKIFTLTKKIESWDTEIYLRSSNHEGEAIDPSTENYLEKLGLEYTDQLIAVDNARMRGLFVRELNQISMYIEELSDIESSYDSFALLKTRLKKLVNQDQILSIQPKNTQKAGYVVKLSQDQIEIQDPLEGNVSLSMNDLESGMKAPKNTEFIGLLNKQLDQSIADVQANKADLNYRKKPRI